MIDIEKYLNEKWEKYRIIASRHPQFSMEKSVCCWESRKDKFYIGCDTWQWDCKLCWEKWNFNTYRKFFGDGFVKLEGAEYVIPKGSLMKEYRTVDKSEIRDNVAKLWWVKKGAVEYLAERWMKEETIKYFNIWVNQYNRLSIPIFEDWKVVDMISWKLPGDKTDTPKYLHDKGSQLSLLNRRILEQQIKPKEVFITEWTFDALTIYQEISEDVVWNVGWCDYLWKDWIELFKWVDRIFIIYDTDEWGIRWANSLAKFLWTNRCVIINLPKEINDVNDYFYKSKYTKEQLMKLIDKHRLEEPEDPVKHISEYSEELLENIKNWDMKGISTWMKELDDILWWYKKWHLILLWALTSVWKSTMGTNLQLALAYVKEPSFFISLEMTPLAIAKKLLQMSASIKLEELDIPSEAILNRVKSWMDNLKDLWIFLFDSCGLLNYQTIEQAIRDSVDNYWMRVVFVDYLQYFPLEWKNRTAEVGDLVNKIKQLAMELGITIILMTQLNRSWRSKQKRGLYIPSLTDLKDSSTLEQSADSVVFICRDNESALEYERRKTVIKVAKNREGKTWYFSANFDGETGVFSPETERDYLVEHENDSWTIEGVEWDDIFR